MSKDQPDRADHVNDNDLFDQPLVRYAGADALLELEDGELVDLNALPDPFTGEDRAAEGMRGLRSPGDDDAAAIARGRIGRRLKALREDAGLSKKEVAKRAGVPLRRVTRVERGEEELGLRLVSALVHVMGAKIADIARPDAREVSNQALERIAETAGVPREVVRRIRAAVDAQRFVDALGRGFGWTREALLAGNPLSPPPQVPMAFKSGLPQPSAGSPMLALAWTLSTASAAVHDARFAGVPVDPRELRRQVMRYGMSADVTIDGLLRWTWDTGIVVLPLTGPGVFHSAVWLVGETPVVVLKESRAFGAYWLFDLAHELGHLALGHVEKVGIVEVGGAENPDLADRQEREANDYALGLLLPDPMAMVADVRRRTANDAPRRFKFAVQDVAREAGIRAGVLGLVAAREMSDVPEDKDRWGSAQNIARDEEPNGRAPVKAAFEARIRLERLNGLDAALLRGVSLAQ